MESLLQIIVLLAFVRCACRASFFRSSWSVRIFALLVTMLSFAFYPIVIEQSGDFYTKMLSDANLVGNIAVLITLEAIIGMLLSIGLLNTLFKKKENSKLHWLKYLPDFLIIAAIPYAEQQMFYALPGYDFKVTAIISALVFSGVVVILTLAIRSALEEIGGRYEFNFLINVFLLLVAILLNAGLSSYNTGSYQSGVEWQSTVAFIGLILLFVVLGFALYQLKIKNKKFKKILKWI